MRYFLGPRWRLRTPKRDSKLLLLLLLLLLLSCGAVNIYSRGALKHGGETRCNAMSSEERVKRWWVGCCAQNVLSAIERDAAGQALPLICSISDSYGVGKAISMVARLASISRAWDTNHYIALDQQIGACLDKWLRVDGQHSLALPWCFTAALHKRFISQHDVVFTSWKTDVQHCTSVSLT